MNNYSERDKQSLMTLLEATKSLLIASRYHNPKDIPELENDVREIEAEIAKREKEQTT